MCPLAKAKVDTRQSTNCLWSLSVSTSQLSGVKSLLVSVSPAQGGPGGGGGDSMERRLHSGVQLPPGQLCRLACTTGAAQPYGEGSAVSPSLPLPDEPLVHTLSPSKALG